MAEQNASINSLEENSSSKEKSDGQLVLGEAFNYDDILEHLGQMGKYQWYTFLWICLPAMYSGTFLLAYSFTGGIPNYRCYIESCDDFTSSNDTNYFTPNWLNNTIPLNDNNSPDQCYRYNYTWTNLEECQYPNTSIDYEMVKECDRWVYDQSLFESTIVTEFELTCENEWKQTLASTVYMFGLLIGAATLGYLGDAIGRRLAFTLITFALALVMTCVAFSPNFTTFCVLRFLAGVLDNGYFIVFFVWGVEAVGKKYQIRVGFFYQMMFSVGAALLGLLAYYVREWRTFQLIISVPLFSFVCIYWIVPESIRWLLTKKRYLESRELILKASKMNKKSIPTYLLLLPDENATTAPLVVQGDSKIEEKARDQINPNNSSTSENIIDVFRSMILLKRLAIMALVWITVVMGYYGITFSATNLSDNFYLNYELIMCIDIPSYVAGIFLVEKIGRRPTVCGGLIISGIACLATGLVPEDSTTLTITFSMIGKLFLNLVFATIYSYTAELFPTSGRTAAIGFCSTLGQVGGILAPLIASAGRRINPSLPFIIFAGANISVGILCLLLPETKHSTLPATVQEAEGLEKSMFSCFQCRRNVNKQQNNSNET